MTPAEDAIWLFAYGTLRQPEVQLALFDVLPGWTVVSLLITDPTVIATSGTAHHAVVRPAGDARAEVPGTVFCITVAELAAADAYEVADVTRVWRWGSARGLRRSSM